MYFLKQSFSIMRNQLFTSLCLLISLVSCNSSAEYPQNCNCHSESITDKTKLIILNSPNNPCGSVMDPSDIKRIADIAKEKDILILTDEVYKDLYFEGSHTSVYDFEQVVGPKRASRAAKRDPRNAEENPETAHVVPR